MNIEEIRSYCLSFRGTTEGFPFDNRTLVFKVQGKMFALIDVETAESINLKCEPEKAIQLREEFSAVKEGYHMSKKHWNTVILQSELSTNQIKEMIDHSYELVKKGLTKKLRDALES